MIRIHSWSFPYILVQPSQASCQVSAAEMPAVAPDSFKNIDAHVERSKEGQDAAPEQQASSEMEATMFSASFGLFSSFRNANHRFSDKFVFYVIVKPCAAQSRCQALHGQLVGKDQQTTGPHKGSQEELLSGLCREALIYIHVVYICNQKNRSSGCALQLHIGMILKSMQCIPRPVKTLEDNITKIDEKYEALNEHMATGETDGYGGEFCSQEICHSNTSQDCSSWHLRICRAQVVEPCREENEGSYHGVRLSNFPNNLCSTSVCILVLFCDMFKMLFDDISPQKNHHVDEVVASPCCGAEGQVLALDVLHFQVQQNITCNQNIWKLLYSKLTKWFQDSRPFAICCL